MSKVVIGVMGVGSATSKELHLAYDLGKSIAENNWVLLTGGRKAGVMDAASRGAKSADGLVVGVLPGGDTAFVSPAVDIAIVTDIGNARNNINVLSSNIVIACGMGLGTASEVALALKSQKQVILLNQSQLTEQFFSSLTTKNLFLAKTVEEAIATIKEILNL